MAGSGAQIKVNQTDLEDLEEKLRRSLNVINEELESTVVLAAACGDSTLGARVIEFGQSWNKHRFDIRDNIQWLHDSVKNIADQLEKVDADLAKGLNPSPTPSPTPAPSPSPAASPSSGGGGR